MKRELVMVLAAVLVLGGLAGASWQQTRLEAARAELTAAGARADAMVAERRYPGGRLPGESRARDRRSGGRARARAKATVRAKARSGSPRSRTRESREIVMSGVRVLYRGPVASVNRWVRISPKHGRPYMAQEYRAFKKALAWEIKLAMGVCPPWPFPLMGPVALRIRAKLPRRTDIDAVLKPVLDSFQLAGAVANDWSFRRLEVIADEVCARGETPELDLWAWEMGGEPDGREESRDGAGPA